MPPFDQRRMYKPGTPSSSSSIAGGLYDAASEPVGVVLENYWTAMPDWLFAKSTP